MVLVVVLPMGNQQLLVSIECASSSCADLKLSARVVTDELPPRLVLGVRRHQGDALTPPRRVPVFLLKTHVVVFDLRVQRLACLLERPRG